MQVSVKREIRKYIEKNKNEGTTFQYLWDVVKAVFRGKFIGAYAYIKKEERSQMNNFSC